MSGASYNNSPSKPMDYWIGRPCKEDSDLSSDSSYLGEPSSDERIGWTRDSLTAMEALNVRLLRQREQLHP